MSAVYEHVTAAAIDGLPSRSERGSRRLGLRGPSELSSRELEEVEAADRAMRLGALFDAHHQRLYRLARRLSGCAEDARDLVQETFLRAARSPGSIPLTGAASEEAWLVRVLISSSGRHASAAATRH